MKHDEQNFDHAPYGMIGWVRSTVSGRHRLLGSSIDQHYATIRVHVHYATRQHSLASDHFYARKKVLELEMSPAQFAEFLTSGNCGDGVPCTLRYVDGERVADPPRVATEAEQVRAGFRERCTRLAERLKAHSHMVDQVLSAPSVTAAGKKLVRDATAGLLREIADSMPFVEESFREATERTLVAAKAEAEAFLAHAIHAAGLGALREEVKGYVPESSNGTQLTPPQGGTGVAR